MNSRYFYFSILISAMHSPIAVAEELKTPLQIFTSCYQRMTSRALPRSHPVRLQLTLPTATHEQAATACADLIDSAVIDNSGMIPNVQTSLAQQTAPNYITNDERIAILNTFNDEHRRWFPDDKFMNNVEKGVCLQSNDLLDESAPALYVTRALFANLPYDSIVKADSTLEGHRFLPSDQYDGRNPDLSPRTSPQIPVNVYKTWNWDETVTYYQMRNNASLGNPAAGMCLWHNFPTLCFTQNMISSVAGFVKTGLLRGIAPMSENTEKHNAFIQPFPFKNGNNDCWQQGYPPNCTPEGFKPAPRVYFNRQVTEARSYGRGGGILNDQSFVTMSFGRTFFEKMNGRAQMPRRLATKIYNHLLCREMPALRTEDVLPLVPVYEGGESTESNPIPLFQKSAGCLICHESMDPLMGAYRNMELRANTPFDCNDPNSLAELAVTSVGNDSNTTEFASQYQPYSPWTKIDPKFSERPPKGKLYYRSINGMLVNQTFENIPDLGSKLAETEDLYTCAASRYVEFFTGARANMQEAGFIHSSPLSDEQTSLRNKVLELGRQFKNHRSVRTLIHQIVSDRDLYWKN